MPAPTQGAIRTSLRAAHGYPSTFNPAWGMFSPGDPMIPQDPQPVRSFDLIPGQNLAIQPRAYEGFAFSELRAFANVEIVRLAIETRKDQIERMGWVIRPKEGRKKRADADERIRKVQRFFAKPNGVDDFHVWLRILMEDLLVLDAPALEKRRNRGGDLVSLEHVPGDTIKLLVDQNGRRPLAPVPAYQQIIKGRVWCDLTTQDLMYQPRNPRSGKLYGLGPVEQTVVTINTALRRQVSQLAYFTDGNVPAGIATVPDTWTPDQVKAWQEWMDSSLSGNLAERRKMLWAPAGSQYQAFKEAPIKDDFDEWLARVVCFAFSLPPTPFIRQMNKGTAQDDYERALEEGLAPLLVWGKRMADSIIADEFGFADLEFAWEQEKELDPDKQAAIHDMYVGKGIMTPDEARDQLGMDPLPGGLGSQPLVYTATGAALLEHSMQSNDPAQQLAQQKELASAKPQPTLGAGGGGGGGGDDVKQKIMGLLPQLMQLMKADALAGHA